MLLHSKDAVGDAAYDRHQPEQTLLYQLVEAHYPALINQLGLQGKRSVEQGERLWMAFTIWVVLSTVIDHRKGSDQSFVEIFR